MKITRTRLRQIIKEEIDRTVTKESSLSPGPATSDSAGGYEHAVTQRQAHFQDFADDRDSVEWAQNHPSTGRAPHEVLSWIEATADRPGQAKTALTILMQYDAEKRDANVSGFDFYFHFLGFASAARYLQDKGWPDEMITNYLWVFLSNAKEYIDYINPLGATFRNFEEWIKDGTTNQVAVRYGLSGDSICDGALTYAKQKGHITVKELIDDPSRWPDWEEDYGDAVIRYRDVYGDDDIFVQPRFHCKIKHLINT